ncbi:hypothetical protein [Methylobacterium soli]|uniref:Uncharacterized protein n=1 Tax=Methylobacterium soli TaxID=553447 RepID=A0A6L3T0C0_9HYPH|nr:hypothetical protein [Methylobacterium soli]KAB1078011.1 hypothetical protein F6X53_16055 [Methylobacterium soli]
MSGYFAQRSGDRDMIVLLFGAILGGLIGALFGGGGVTRTVVIVQIGACFGAIVAAEILRRRRS